MRRAVVLFNLGGPDAPEAVKPFLFNLFNDAAIIGVPQPLRWLLAKFISARRAPVAREIYGELGGKSPLVELTWAQAHALEDRLVARARRQGVDDSFKVVVAMRYWHPFADDAAREVAAFGAEEVIALPLYPQFSTTTTGSSLKDWRLAARRAGLTARERCVCCYPTAPGFIEAHVALLRPHLDAAAASGAPVRILFSAHGLPKRVIERGDPYQWQVEQSAAAIMRALRGDGAGAGGQPNPALPNPAVPDPAVPEPALADPALPDHVVCYQSRVGPLEWIGPSTEDEIRRAGREGCALVVVPIAFVSEHSETLVELDIEYAALARAAGVPAYHRVPALGTQPRFIDMLAQAVEDAGRMGAAGRGAAPMGAGNGDRAAVASFGGGRLCPAGMGACPCPQTPAAG